MKIAPHFLRLCIFLICQLVYVVCFRAYNGFGVAWLTKFNFSYKLIQTTPVTIDQLQALEELKQKFVKDNQATIHEDVDLVDFWRESHGVNQSTDIFVSPQLTGLLMSFLKNNALEAKIMMKDVGKVLREQHKVQNLRKSATLANGQQQFDAAQDPSQFNLNQYHSYEEIIDYQRSVAKKYSTFVKAGSLGNSFEKRELAYLKIGYPSQRPKNAIFMDAGIHARAGLVYVIPLMNPDGYEYSRVEDRMWRKTRSGPSSSGQCYGADPNRNFPFHWCTTGASKDACSYQEYCGSKPLSEVECQQLASFLADNLQNIKAYITLHSFGNVLIHPFGHKPNAYPHDVKDLKSVGNAAAKAILRAGGPLYEVGTTMEVIGYTASGASDDFAKGLGIKYVYTMELTDTHYGFLLPSHLIRTTAQHVLPAFVVFAEAVWNLDESGKEE